jgi:hypothetical protein
MKVIPGNGSAPKVFMFAEKLKWARLFSLLEMVEELANYYPISNNKPLLMKWPLYLSFHSFRGTIGC